MNAETISPNPINILTENRTVFLFDPDNNLLFSSENINSKMELTLSQSIMLEALVYRKNQIVSLDQMVRINRGVNIGNINSEIFNIRTLISTLRSRLKNMSPILHQSLINRH